MQVIISEVYIYACVVASEDDGANMCVVMSDVVYLFCKACTLVSVYLLFIQVLYKQAVCVFASKRLKEQFTWNWNSVFEIIWQNRHHI